MPAGLSPRLAAIAEALPLRPGLRVLEIGCGPGALARAICGRIGDGTVLALDRSATAIAQARAACAGEVRAGRLQLRQAAVEDFALPSEDPLFDLAVAIRVGALDGRHPQLAERALRNIAAALVPGGALYIDGGDPLRRLELPPG
jgi:cyclopropane fatty-acyl-phospholipid synthase-like methyltransferase